MSIIYLVLFTLFSDFLILTNSVPTPPLTEHTTRSFRHALNQQSLQTILQSIEERLRNLDQIYAIRYPRPDPNKDNTRRLDLLESKLTRIESLIELQQEKLSENINSKNFKDDITKDQIFRKIDSVYERINHKMSYLESKIDIDTLKLQSKIENSVSRIERLDHFIGVRHADIEAEITDGVEMIETIKNSVSSIETKVVNVTKHTLTNFQEQLHPKFQNLIEKIEKTINNNSQYQCNHRDVLNDFSIQKINDYENKINNYGNKMTNMYNDLWRKSINIENTIEKSIQVTNLTRKEIDDKMNNILKHFGNKNIPNDNPNNSNLEIVLDSFSNTVQRKFSDLNRKIEDNFQNVMLAQNLFLESCHRIQLDETQLENKIGLVLEKLLDSFDNKSASIFREIQNVEEMLKSHDLHVYRSLNQNTNNMIKLSEKSSEDRKKLEKILSAMKHDLANSLTKIFELSENESGGQKLDLISSILQELQEQVNDLDNKMTEDNATYNSKQIIQELLQEMKALVLNETFTKQRTRLENQATVSTIQNMIQEIYSILTTKDKEEIMLEILPEYHQTKNNSFFDRFNYTLIKNNNTKETNLRAPPADINLISIQPQLNIENRTLSIINETQSIEEHFDVLRYNLTQLQDSFEYTDLKNLTNEDGFIEEVSDLPEYEEYEFQ